MEKNGLIALKKTRFVTTTQADPNHRSALWVSDITLIPTDEGKPVSGGDDGSVVAHDRRLGDS